MKVSSAPFVVALIMAIPWGFAFQYFLGMPLWFTPVGMLVGGSGIILMESDNND